MVNATLCFLIKDAPEKTILLGMKKRGFGANKWNGIGGKIAENETPGQSTVREVAEEIGVKLSEDGLEKLAELTFLSVKGTDEKKLDMFVHVFVAREWNGEPKETEEMLPKWFSAREIPFESMWVDDVHWLPLVIEGKKFRAEFTFGEDNETLLSKKIEPVEEFI